jgi:hypothetical protein
MWAGVLVYRGLGSQRSVVPADFTLPHAEIAATALASGKAVTVFPDSEASAVAFVTTRCSFCLTRARAIEKSLARANVSHRLLVVLGDSASASEYAKVRLRGRVPVAYMPESQEAVQVDYVPTFVLKDQLNRISGVVVGIPSRKQIRSFEHNVRRQLPGTGTD